MISLHYPAAHFAKFHEDDLLCWQPEGGRGAADYWMLTSWSMLYAHATERSQFCPQLRTMFSSRRRNVIEVDAVFNAMRRCGSAGKIVQEPEQVETLFSGTLIAAKPVCDAALAASSVREFCVPDTRNPRG
jgi:hypothetical protein